MNNLLRTSMALGLGFILVLSAQKAAGSNDSQINLVSKIRTQQVAKKHVKSLGLSMKNMDIQCASPQKIGWKRAMGLRSAVGTWAALKLARSVLVPVFINSSRATTGKVIGVVIRPRGNELKEVLGSMTRPVSIINHKQQYPREGDPNVIEEKTPAGPATQGRGIAAPRTVMKVLGDMIRGIDQGWQEGPEPISYSTAKSQGLVH